MFAPPNLLPRQIAELAAGCAECTALATRVAHKVDTAGLEGGSHDVSGGPTGILPMSMIRFSLYLWCSYGRPEIRLFPVVARSSGNNAPLYDATEPLRA